MLHTKMRLLLYSYTTLFLNKSIHIIYLNHKVKKSIKYTLVIVILVIV